MENIVENLFILPKSQQQMHLKLLQSEKLKKTAKGTGDLIGNEVLIKLQGLFETNQ